MERSGRRRRDQLVRQICPATSTAPSNSGHTRTIARIRSLSAGVQRLQEYVGGRSAAQANNGWVTMTTLYEYHFDETQQLNESGRMQLRWILENAPVGYRYAFVQAGNDSISSELRLAAVKANASQLVGPDQVPPVLVRVISPLDRPTEEVDDIRRFERKSIFKPIITPPILTNAIGTSAASGSGDGT